MSLRAGAIRRRQPASLWWGGNPMHREIATSLPSECSSLAPRNDTDYTWCAFNTQEVSQDTQPILLQVRKRGGLQSQIPRKMKTAP